MPSVWGELGHPSEVGCLTDPPIQEGSSDLAPDLLAEGLPGSASVQEMPSSFTSASVSPTQGPRVVVRKGSKRSRGKEEERTLIPPRVESAPKERAS